MANDSIRVLLVVGHDDDARRIETALGGKDSGHVIVREPRLEAALSRLEEPFDIALLDLQLPDASGIEAYVELHARRPSLPVVVITDQKDESLALQAVNLGAQDFVPKDALHPELVRRTLRYAIERERLLAELRELALRDELTGLHNRRGLLTLGEQYARIAERRQGHVVVLFIDINDMKRINDRFGHAAGDQAVKQIAEILLETFRKSDVIARVGGDEFCVLLTETTAGAVEIAIARLYGVLAGHNAREERPYRLSVSVGRASWEGSGSCDFEALVRLADQSMYAQKQRGLKAA
jgi:diguanylate cyclase (GGDEF)-like protein